MCRWFVCICLISISVLTAVADEDADLDAYARLARLGRAAEEKHDYATARRNFDVGVQRYPKNAFAYWNRGTFFMARHEYALALQDFDKAVVLHPVVWTYARWRGSAYAKLGKYDLALADFNKILSFQPFDELTGELLNQRAWIEATCPDARYRNGKRGIADARFAVRFGTSYQKANYLDTLAAAYAEAGDFDAAIKYEEQAIAAQTKYYKLFDPDERLAAFRQHRPYRDQPSKGRGKEMTTRGGFD